MSHFSYSRTVRTLDDFADAMAKVMILCEKGLDGAYPKSMTISTEPLATGDGAYFRAQASDDPPDMPKKAVTE
jgi:hypothetical protein